MLTTPINGSVLKKYSEGDIYQFFGENIALYLQAISSRGHTGIDIATFDGDEVRAAHDGVVVERYNAQAGYGYHIRIVSPKQNGIYLETIYGHLREDMAVNINEQVKAGDVIGYESNTGFVISGSTQYWGTAPAGKGVHLHFGLRLLEDPAPNTQQTSYSSGHSFTIKNYSNGLFGYINPMPYFNPMIEFYREAGREAVYAKVNGKYLWISYQRMEDFVAAGLAKWEDIRTITDKIIQEGSIS